MRKAWRAFLVWLFVDARPSSAPVGIWQAGDTLYVNGVEQL